ncbi:cAMP-specific 3',5'-cyclic phosphodiesterase 4A [Platysternon megacephalum]|uniref:cAMP-specific 3',5'-cyclic phosphodiesterase 4A n=1 Tax=Platysternon megacephalum TaxID=55544 RepID=A0A4D9DLV8_9SAUR|nr:cAMP-specific 3',5'-cyclic phosphodiesterase 4A [Platysternon megacephalum]
MTAPPRLGAAPPLLLLLLLLLAPPPAPLSPPDQPASPALPFELPRVQICGLASADWVIELRRLWEDKEAGRIDARQGGRGLAPNPTSAPLPPHARPPIPSTARPPEPHGLTARPPEPHGLTDGPPEPHGPPARPPEPHGLTAGPPEPHGPTARPPEPHGLTDGPPEPHGPPARPPEPHGLTDGPPEPHGPPARPPEPHGPTDEALTTDPVGGPGLAPRKREGAGDGAPPGQPRPYLTAVPVLLGTSLVLLGVLTYVRCRRSRRPPHRDSGTGTLYHPCKLR